MPKKSPATPREATISELAVILGVTERRLEDDAKAGMIPSRIGPRGVRIFNVAFARAWRRKNRRQVYGEGRSRKSSADDAVARKARLAVGATRSERQRPLNVDIADLDPGQLLALVAQGTLDLAHISTYERAISAMQKGDEYRARARKIIDADELAVAVAKILQAARSVHEAQVEAIVEAVAACVPLTDAQRQAVRAAAQASSDQTLAALADLSRVIPQ